jgi:hypothetical protein
MRDHEESQMRPNKRLELTKRDLLASGPALARRRRASFIESRFAAQPQSSTDVDWLGRSWLT